MGQKNLKVSSKSIVYALKFKEMQIFIILNINIHYFSSLGSAPSIQ